MAVTRYPAEQAVSLAEGMEQIHRSIAHRFKRPETRQRVLDYLQGLIGPALRKNSNGLAQQSQASTSKGMLRLLSEYQWDCDLVQGDLRTYVSEQLGQPDGVLVLNETSFRRVGSRSVGVEKQLNKSSGRMANSQVGLFLAYLSRLGWSLVDRELYLPETWANDHHRRRSAGVPEELEFRPKAELAQVMVQRALDCGLPFTWVTGDKTYGSDPQLRIWLERQGLRYVFGVEPADEFWTWPHSGSRAVTADNLGRQCPPSSWRLMRPGQSASPFQEWNMVPIRPTGYPRPGGWLLVRRCPTRRQLMDFHVCFGRPETTLEDLVVLVGTKSTARRCCEQARHSVGLDQYRVRNWESWYRHMTLCLFAQAFLNVHEGLKVCDVQPNPNRSKAKQRIRLP